MYIIDKGANKAMDTAKRSSFIFCVGYEGETALVDGNMVKKYSGYTTMQLAEAGLFRAACASAIFSDKQTEIDAFISYYNRTAGLEIASKEELTKLFGVSVSDFAGKKIRVL
jgi:hypothetical protein